MTIPCMDSRGIYEGLRKVFLLGLRIRPIVQALDLRPGEKFLDAGCGYGFFVKYSTKCDYTGIDVDDSRIRWAKERLGENAHRRFITSSITQTQFAEKSFHTALGYGLLHHLRDDDAKKTTAELARIVKNKIVFSEPVYSKYHWFNNFLCRMDQGPYVRTREDYLRICETSLTVCEERFFYARNGLAKYLLITAAPRETA